MLLRLSIIAFMFLSLSACSKRDTSHIQSFFKGQSYTCTFDQETKYSSDSILEIGYGSGHGHNLQWIKFQPKKNGIEVLNIKYSLQDILYKGDKSHSEWPPSAPPISVKVAVISQSDYQNLLDDIAIVEAAQLKPIKESAEPEVQAEPGEIVEYKLPPPTTRDHYFSTRDFWVNVLLKSATQTLIERDWAGYQSYEGEIEFTKPEAAVMLTFATIEKINFQNHELTDAERNWVSEKFRRDWQKIVDKQDYWWVRDRFLTLVGVTGNNSLLPDLMKIVDSSENIRNRFNALNAIVRLKNIDLGSIETIEGNILQIKAAVMAQLQNQDSQIAK